MIDQILPKYGYNSDNNFFYIINYKPPLTYLFDKFFSTNIKKDLSKNLKLTMIVLLVKKNGIMLYFVLKRKTMKTGEVYLFMLKFINITI